ncbi:MAG: hypothetical protein QXL43_04000, partial [Methanolinea sp.]
METVTFLEHGRREYVVSAADRVDRDTLSLSEKTLVALEGLHGGRVFEVGRRTIRAKNHVGVARI